MGFGSLDWSNWLYGLFAALIGGGAGAVVSGVAVSMMDPKDFSFGSGKFFALVATIFLTHGSVSAFMFLKQQPLPAIRTTTTTVETTERQAHPPAVVKTTVAETKVEPLPPSPENTAK